MRLRWPGSKVDGAPEKVDTRAGNYVQNLKNANFAHKEDTQIKKTGVIYVQLKKEKNSYCLPVWQLQYHTHSQPGPGSPDDICKRRHG